MAMATRKSPAPEPSRHLRKKGAEASKPPGSPGLFRSIYRFLASLKLAIVTLSTLVIVLTAGMIFERSYGNHALQVYFYRTWWFGLLLVLLATNILCAATIRYPWKKRQTGFVVTHAGLLVLLLGSWISFQTGGDGQVAMVEGDHSNTLTAFSDHRIRVQPLDPETGEPKGEGYSFPFFPGSFDWRPGRSETLTRSNDPFELTVDRFFPASTPRFVHVESESGGVPMVRLIARITPPGSSTSMDVFQNDPMDRAPWLAADPIFARKAKSVGPALLRFSYLDTGNDADLINDFLDLPDGGKLEFARVRYTDSAGRDRMVRYTPSTGTWDLGGGRTASGPTLQLPGSDLTATYKPSGDWSSPGAFERMATEFELGTGEGHSHIRLADFLQTIAQGSGDPTVPFVEFEVSKAGGPALTHWGTEVARVATIAFKPGDHDPNVLAPTNPLIRISYYHPPAFATGMQGLKGVVDVVGTSGGKLMYRAVNDEGVQGSGRLELGEQVDAFGGSPTQPMRLSIGVDEFLRSGREDFTYAPIQMAVGQAGNGIPAIHLDMKVKGETRDAWLRLGISPDLKPDPREAQVLRFDRAAYRVWFDLDRQPLPFDLKLIDFRRRFDPGVMQARSYESDVLLSDEEQQIENKPVTISMNEPLSHRGYTFYQSSFTPPDDGSGQFVSLFQVRYDPYWHVVYLGCLLVVVGVFLQFYMRAGVFTDGGKREREREALKKAVDRPAVGGPAPGPSLDEPL